MTWRRAARVLILAVVVVTGLSLGLGEPPAEFSGSLAAHRPASARIVERDQPAEVVGAVPLSSDDDTPWLAIGAGVALVVAGTAGLVILRRRKRPVDVDVDGTYL